MRKTGIKLAGLAVVLAGVAGADKAEAGPVEVTTATTTPLQTSQPAAPGDLTPGNVTVAAGGSIAVTTGQSAITLNSNNNVTNNGSTGLTSNDASGSRGIRIVGGFSGDVSSTGAISLIETYTAADGDADGDLDGEWAQGTDRIGILLEGGTHTGAISNTGPIGIEGDDSYGIRLNSLLSGNLTNGGNITIIGDNSAAIAITGGAGAGVNGNVVLSAGSINVRGAGSRGLLVDAPISGELSISGTINVSGFHATTRPNDATKLDADDFLLSGAAVEVRRSVLQGITIEGIGVEDDVDDDGDGVTEGAGDTNDDAGGQIQSFSNAPAFLIAADPSANLVLGATASGYGFHARGSVASLGVYDGVETTALRIQGTGTSTVTTAGGILLDNTFTSITREADVFGVIIGQNAIVPSFVTRKNITTQVVAEGAFDGYAVLFESGAQVPSFTNTGSVLSQALGEVSNATAIVDRSNTLATINNSGLIRAELIPTDTDGTDDIVPVATGSAIAIDVSGSSIGVTLNQTADAVFTDDDTVDDDTVTRPAVRIEGDVRFGSGSDTLNLSAGAIVGDVDFGAGTNVFNINNGATFLGRIGNSGGLTLNVVNGILAVDGGTTNFSSAVFQADGELSVLLSENVSESTRLLASGVVQFDPGSVVTPIIPVGLPLSGSSVFLTAAGGLVGAANVERTLSGPGSSYLYNLAVARPVGDPNSLAATYVLKSTSELGLNRNESAAFNPILAALRTNNTASLAMSQLDTQEEFESAYDDLLPTFSGGATELAATAIQQSQSAATNRLAATRLHNIDDVSLWVQEIGYGLTREPQTTNGVEFRGYGFGLAGGIDGPLDNGALFGLSASFITSVIEEPGRADGELSASFGQANAYLGTAMGPIDLDFVAGLGVGKMSSTRRVEIGNAFVASTEADWWAYEGHGAARASLPLALTDWFIVTPHAALTYVALNEAAYEEEGGGAAFNYDVESQFAQRLWADVGVEFSGRWRLSGEGMLAPRLMLGYRANVLSDDAEREFRLGGGTPFTLVDESSGEGAPLIGVGIDATNGFSTFSLSYEGEFGDEIDRHSLNAAVRFRF
ncbi:putative autotransporter protein [alpha proteobacterium U9-1i]|nr:putative autotransporter protein [alpha proteobacterium U9-1i]